MVKVCLAFMRVSFIDIKMNGKKKKGKDRKRDSIKATDAYYIWILISTSC